MANKNLPVKDDKDFIGEFETMDLDELRDKQFVVAVNTGSTDKGKFICTTTHGPYDYNEMIEEVGTMWKQHQHHAKVYILEKKREVRVKWLDANTIDYIEANWEELVMEGILDGSIEEKDFTCRAGIIEADKEDDPRMIANEEDSEEDDL